MAARQFDQINRSSARQQEVRIQVVTDLIRNSALRFLRCALAILVIASAASAQDSATVSNVFIETDLRQALEDIAAQAKVNIIADPSVQGVITVALENVTVAKALTLMLAGTNYQVQQNSDYFLVYNPDEASGVFPSVAETKMVTLQSVQPETARGLLPNGLQRYVRVSEGTNMLAVTAPKDLMKRIIDDLVQIDRSSADDTAFVALDYIKAATARSMLPDNLQRFVRVDPDRNTVAVTAPKGTRERILSQIARLDVALPAGSYDTPNNVHRTKVVKLNHAKAVGTLALLPPALATYVRADEESNTLAVSAPDNLLAGILADISAIDMPRKHIMLDARVVVLERGDLLDFGADWKLPQLTAGGVLGDAVGFPWELQIGYSSGREFTNALSLTLNLLTQNNEATVIASPQVLAQDGKQAEIKVTTEEYFQITADAGTYIRADLEKIETGTILGITPQVGPNGELTLDMAIEVSDVVSRGEQGLPVVSRRTAKSTVQIESGGTAAIAGLVDTRSQFGRSGIPGSTGLPILGRAFRTDTLRHRARQVAVFVTATCVEPGKSRIEKGPKRPAFVSHVDAKAFRLDLEAALDRSGAVADAK